MEWKKFKALEIKSPEELIIETIKGFSEATNNLVDMKLLKKSDFEKVSSKLKNQFEYELILFSKYIKGYSFSILEFGFDVELYPVNIAIDVEIYNELNFDFRYDRKVTSIKDEEEFVKSLNFVFQSKRFQTIIGGLMKLATNEMEEF